MRFFWLISLMACSGNNTNAAPTAASSPGTEAPHNVTPKDQAKPEPKPPIVCDPLATSIQKSQEFGAPSKPESTQVIPPSNQFSVEDPEAGADWNVYPANNAVILQGTLVGPIGNHSRLMVWMTGSIPFDQPDGTSRLEMAMVYEVEEDDGPGDDAITVHVPSSRDTTEQSAILLGVQSLTARDTNGDGQAEVVVEATFRPHCDSAEAFTETIVLTVDGTDIRPSYPKGDQ